ncbi:MAG: hypothetical protein HY689_00305 [Chloroflexi bacterium]|nr:hypothetical protein [Chloroflexota bacterium]
MMAEHTPGPWYVSRDRSLYRDAERYGLRTVSAVEQQCLAAQQRYQTHLQGCDKCNGGRLDACGVETALLRSARAWERLVRA